MTNLLKITSKIPIFYYEAPPHLYPSLRVLSVIFYGIWIFFSSNRIFYSVESVMTLL